MGKERVGREEGGSGKEGEGKEGREGKGGAGEREGDPVCIFKFSLPMLNSQAHQYEQGSS